MAVQLSSATAITRLGQVQVYLGRTDIDEVRRFRDIFGGVTLQGKNGLRLVKELDRAGELFGVDLDPAVYASWKKADEQLSLDLDIPSTDWVRTQADLGLPVIRTAGQRIQVGRADEIRAELEKVYPVPVVTVLALDNGWLGQRHIDTLLTLVEAADRDIALVLAAKFDPLDSGPKISGLHALLDWSKRTGRRLELLRTDHVGLPAVTVGASLASIGLTTSTRHLGLPLRRKERDEYEERQHSPLVFVPRLLHWQRGKVLNGLSLWGGAGVTDCSCSPCSRAGTDLLRFAQVFTGPVPTPLTKAIREHDAHALSELARSILDSPNPQAQLRHLRRVAQNLTVSVAANQRVSLDIPPWVNCWEQ